MDERVRKIIERLRDPWSDRNWANNDALMAEAADMLGELWEDAERYRGICERRIEELEKTIRAFAEPEVSR
jgi:hypothetical protein